jgi:CRP/FNR family transcriptional regulator
VAGRAGHEQVAQALGSSRVVISRLLKQLENNKQVLLFRNQIKVMVKL